MIEAHSTGEADELIDVLSYKLPDTATYFTDRKSVSFFASGSNEYSTSGTKLIKLAVNGDNWMDPSTFRISFDIVNTDTSLNALLRPLSGGHSFFS